MKIFGYHQGNTLNQFFTVAGTCEHAALMADGHLGYDMPIGGVAAYDNQVSVTGVGFDIACGNAAIQTGLYASGFSDKEWEELADEIQARISFGVGGVNREPDAPVDHPLFRDDAWEALAFLKEAMKKKLLPKHISPKSLKERARAQLGSVGSGNHYVDVFQDPQDGGRIWVGVHFGSRGLGYTIAQTFIRLHKLMEPKVGRQSAVMLDLDTPMGEAYWTLMELAGQYAYAGREWTARKVVSLLGGSERLMVHNHHNYAWKEEHFGRELVVVRKGATSALPGQMGFVGGSMGDDSVILQGTGLGDAELALFSTVHGAGRIMSRTQAKASVTHKEVDEWLEREGVIIRGGGLDEAPQAYRRLGDVLRAQGDTIQVLHTLKPIIAVMA